jgi:hypothetical protein
MPLTERQKAQLTKYLKNVDVHGKERSSLRGKMVRQLNKGLTVRIAHQIIADKEFILKNKGKKVKKNPVPNVDDLKGYIADELEGKFKVEKLDKEPKRRDASIIEIRTGTGREYYKIKGIRSGMSIRAPSFTRAQRQKMLNNLGERAQRRQLREIRNIGEPEIDSGFGLGFDKEYAEKTFPIEWDIFKRGKSGAPNEIEIGTEDEASPSSLAFAIRFPSELGEYGSVQSPIYSKIDGEKVNPRLIKEFVDYLENLKGQDLNLSEPATQIKSGEIISIQPIEATAGGQGVPIGVGSDLGALIF